MVDADGRVEGLLTLGVIEQLLSDEAAEPAGRGDEAAEPAGRGEDAVEPQPESLR